MSLATIWCFRLLEWWCKHTMPGYEGSIDWPRWEEFSDIPIFNTKAVVQQTGVPAPTLRAWERRYKLLTPKRGKNAYRLYTERDIALIRWLKGRIDTGINISQAIALFHRLQQQPQTTRIARSQTAFEITPMQFVRPLVPNSKNAIHDTYISERDMYPNTHNLHLMREHLIDIFHRMDEAAAHVVIGTALSFYSIEQVCAEIIVPTLHQIGQLWCEGKLTVSTEHFASNFFRAMLTNRLHITPSPSTGPFVLTCCAPGEGHELGILMLSLFLRLQRIRIAYLGQSVESAGLLHTVRLLHPTMICVSLTMPAYFDTLKDLGESLQQLPAPRPLFVFGGQAFTGNFALPHSKVPGLYLDGPIQEITAHIVSLLQQE